MQLKHINDYNKFITYLIKIGIDPAVLSVSNIIDSITKNNNEFDFDTTNIIPGPTGELIKINYENNDIEIYKVDERYYLIETIDLNDGSIKFDKVGEKNFIKDVSFFGTYFYNQLINAEEKDYSEVRRVIFNDGIKYSSRKLEDKNKRIREELPNLKEDLSKYLSDFYAHDGVRRIIDKVNEAYNYQNAYKYFDSKILSGDTIWVINNKLKYDFLKKESDKFSEISIFPLTEISEEYSKYNTKETDRVVNRINKIMSKIYCRIDKFHSIKKSVLSEKIFLDGEIKSIKRHTLLFVRRTKELNEKKDISEN